MGGDGGGRRPLFCIKLSTAIYIDVSTIITPESAFVFHRVDVSETKIMHMHDAEHAVLSYSRVSCVTTRSQFVP